MTWTGLPATDAPEARLRCSRRRWLVTAFWPETAMPKTKVLAAYSRRQDAEDALRCAGYRTGRLSDAGGEVWTRKE